MEVLNDTDDPIDIDSEDVQFLEEYCRQSDEDQDYVQGSFDEDSDVASIEDSQDWSFYDE